MPHLRVRSLLCAILPLTGLTAQEWGQFRGPLGQGSAAEGAAYPTTFGPEDKLLWKAPVGAGHSSPVVSGDRIYLTEGDEEQLAVVCIDRNDGSTRWRHPLEPLLKERLHQVNSAATPTVCTDGNHVVASFGTFGLVCLDPDGAELWRRELEPARNQFGTASSPVLLDGVLFFLRDTQDRSQLTAIDPSSGESLWEVEREGFVSGWSTPTLIHVGDQRQLLVYGSFHLTAYDPADGSELWTVPGLADEPCITPGLGDGLVYVTSYNMRINPEVIGLPTWGELIEQYDGDGSGDLDRDEVAPNKSVLSRMDADGEGDHSLRGFFRFLDADRDDKIEASEWPKMQAWIDTFEHRNAVVAIRPGDGEQGAEIRWQFGRGVPECPSPLVHDGRVYLVKNGGMITCLDAATGDLHFQGRLGSRGPHYASPVYGDGKIYSASARGQVTVFAAGPTLEVLARNDLGERIMATPALVDGRIYLRSAEHLWAFGAAR